MPTRRTRLKQSFDSRNRERASHRRSYRRQRAKHEHPVFTHDQLAWVRDSARQDPVESNPDRREFASDADRQAAISAHATRVKDVICDDCGKALRKCRCP